jgi:predicted protein tyrosine phosphatase
MNVIVASRHRVEAGLRVGVPFALISITDHGAPPARLPPDPLRRGVLRLGFDDARPEDQPLDGWERPRLMTAADARAVWRFFLSHQHDVGTLVVHCEAGWSRSPAVAAAILHAIGEDATPLFRAYHPNVFVFRRMLAAAPRSLRLGLPRNEGG